MAAKSVKKNYLYNVSYQVLVLLVPLVTTPYVSRVLGAEGVGTYSYLSSLTAYFVMVATLGTTTYGQREVSYVQEDRHARSLAFFDTLLIRLVTTVLSVAAYLAFLGAVGQGSPVAVVLALNVVAVAADISWFFQGMEEFGTVVGRNFVFRILSVLFIFLFVKAPSDLAVYALGLSALPVLGNLSLVPFLSSYIEPVAFSELHPFRRMPTVMSLFVPTVAMQVYLVLDKTMIGVITGSAAQNGYYEQSQKLANMALTLVTALGVVMVPRIGYLFAGGKRREVRVTMSRTYRFVWFLALPLAFGLAAVADNLVPWFFGEGYGEVVPLLVIFSGQIVAIGVNNATGIQYLIPTGRQNLFTLSVTLGAAVNLSLNLALIPVLQARGAAIASVVAESAIAVYQLIIMRYELDVPAALKSCVPYLAGSAFMYAALRVLAAYLSPGPLHTAVLIAAGGAIYGAFLLIIRDRFVLEVLSQVRGAVMRRVQGE